ncbi:MAG TPA: aminoglycoside phosphotransferase family protein [Pseudomonadales bacterium]
MTDPARRALAAWSLASARLAPLGEGHINDTWLVERPDGERFVLQRLSAAVFPDPRQVSEKVARVVEHLHRRGDVRVPALLPAGARPWHEDSDGVLWRLWEFVAPARTLQRLETAAQGRAAGAAFGRLQRALADLPGPLPDPIPGFLQLGRYLAELDLAVRDARTDAGVDAALAAIDRRRDLAALFTERDRPIHGDGKIDNLLFAPASDEVLCIVDLDTVMRGHWAWDFGDLARSAAADGDRVNVERFASLARGFVESGALGGGPSAAERREALLLAPRHLALMLAVRFLTDHLRGDRYFKVSGRGENLRRARVQLDLLVSMEREERRLDRALAAL